MSMREYRRWFLQKEDGSETLEVLCLTAIAAAVAILAARVFMLAKGGGFLEGAAGFGVKTCSGI